MEGQCQRAPEWHLQGTSSKHWACVMGEHCVVTAAGMASSFFVAALESCVAQKRQVSAPVHLRALRSLATAHHLFRLFALRAAKTADCSLSCFSAQGLTHHVACMCVFVTRHVLLNGLSCYCSLSLLGLKCNTASAGPRFQKELMCEDHVVTSMGAWVCGVVSFTFVIHDVGTVTQCQPVHATQSPLGRGQRRGLRTGVRTLF